MKVMQKRLADGKVCLEVVASPAEVNDALHSAQLSFAQSMGLRPEQGKTVAQVAEERMGIRNLDSIVSADAIKALVPFALDKKNIAPLFPPTPEPKSPFERGRQFSFDLVVTLKPLYELSSYDPIEITIAPYEFDESLVQQQIDQMAEQHTTYIAAEDKAIESGDACLIAIEASKDGEPQKGLSTEGRTYVTGQGYMPDGFDEQIIGMRPGETKSFSFEGPSFDDDWNEITETIDCVVTIKEIQTVAVPEIDDEWISKYMPMYKGVDDFRAELRRGLDRQMRAQYDLYRRQAAVAEISKRFQNNKIPDEAYEAARSNLVDNIRVQLQSQGKSWEEFVSENGGEQQLGMMLMLQTRESLVSGFALDAVFRHEKLKVTEQDIDAACFSINPQMSPKQVRLEFERSGRGFALREAAERLKANDWLLENAIIHVQEA